MYATLEKQTMVSLQKEKYMEKWGMHHYRQTVRALNLQYKANCRDPYGAFGGKLFAETTIRGNEIFNSMPPPKESLPTTQPQKAKEITRITT